ncbi:hypothetical protein AX15_003646 [Amanita polypyramis BW_CC]|nr:hypothetical protein AX15_003646 [Amanita polypyramis BW_CC]
MVRPPIGMDMPSNLHHQLGKRHSHVSISIVGWKHPAFPGASVVAFLTQSFSGVFSGAILPNHQWTFTQPLYYLLTLYAPFFSFSQFVVRCLWTSYVYIEVVFLIANGRELYI